jgi:hypothetical protein
MKVLFVGEGPHDVGSSEFAPKPQQASGVVPCLSRKVCPDIGIDSVAFYWREIPVLNREKKKRGFAAKVASAIVLSNKYQCQGTICVTDRDGDETRLGSMEEGIERGKSVVGNEHRVVCGVAVESVESWTLGAPVAMASVLNEPKANILKFYAPTAVEEFNQCSGKQEKRPKHLLKSIAEGKHKKDCVEWREEIANATDLDELCENCKIGFEPFRRKLVATFGPRS